MIFVKKSKPFIFNRLGDPDLFVSHKNYPTYEIQNHDLSSYSCGDEKIIIEER